MEDSTDDAPEPVVFRADEEINPSLPPARPPLNLQTPQACVESFLLAARNGDFRRASHALNFRLAPDIDIAGAATIAEHFFFVLNQELWVDWEGLPDRRDGMTTGSAIGEASPMAGQARKSIRLGSIDADGRSIPIRVQRLQPPEGDPVWLFSAQTVDNIPLLYEAHGPGWLDRQMPSWARERGWGRVSVWKWIALCIVAVAAPAFGLAMVFLVRKLIKRVPGVRGATVRRFDYPVAAVVITFMLLLVANWALSLPNEIAAISDPILLILFVASATWLLVRVFDFAMDRLGSRAIRKIHDGDPATERRLLTQMTVARHVVLLLVVMVGIGVVLQQLDIFRTVGTALISSAGVAAVIFGIAGHAVLGNLIAGIQIALSQPFKVGDTVNIEGKYGWIESVMYTYVVVRSWDNRRIVFPIKYFVNNWFENYSHTEPVQSHPIYLHVDYRADVERIREKFMQLLREDEDWDEDTDSPQVIVYETKEETILLRMLCGAGSPGDAWDLHCRIRERVVAWLQQVEEGRWLPRRRLLLSERPELRIRSEETVAAE